MRLQTAADQTNSKHTRRPRKRGKSRAAKRPSREPDDRRHRDAHLATCETSVAAAGPCFGAAAHMVANCFCRIDVAIAELVRHSAAARRLGAPPMAPSRRPGCGICGAIPGSVSSTPRRTETSGPSGHVPPNRLERSAGRTLWPAVLRPIGRSARCRRVARSPPWKRGLGEGIAADDASRAESLSPSSR